MTEIFHHTLLDIQTIVYMLKEIILAYPVWQNLTDAVMQQAEDQQKCSQDLRLLIS